MSEMVERVARALCLSKRNSPKDYPSGWLERHVNENWHLFEDDARTAIAAMREPTQNMIEAPYSLRASADDFIHKSFYQAMIDEALK